MTTTATLERPSTRTDLPQSGTAGRPQRATDPAAAPVNPAVARYILGRATAHRLAKQLQHADVDAVANTPDAGTIWYVNGTNLTTALITVSGDDCELTTMRVRSTTATGRVACDLELTAPTSDLSRLVDAFIAADIAPRATRPKRHA